MDVCQRDKELGRQTGGDEQAGGKDRVQKPATGEICGTALNRVGADIAGLQDAAVLQHGAVLQLGTR